VRRHISFQTIRHRFLTVLYALRPTVRSHCRVVVLLSHFIPYAPYSVALFLKRQCDLTLGPARVGGPRHELLRPAHVDPAARLRGRAGGPAARRRGPGRAGHARLGGGGPRELQGGLRGAPGLPRLRLHELQRRTKLSAPPRGGYVAFAFLSFFDSKSVFYGAFV
jgi:hypothetical protein